MRRLKNSWETKSTAYSVNQLMKDETEEGACSGTQEFLNEAVQPTGIAAGTIKKVPKETNLRQQGQSTSLNIAMKPISNREYGHCVKLDSFGKGVLKRLIHKFHAEEKSMPSMIRLLVKLKREVSYYGSTAHLRGQIKRVGFIRHKTVDHQDYYLEGSNVRLQRSEYLEKIKTFRMQGRPIIFTAVIYVSAPITNIEQLCPSYGSANLNRPGVALACAGSSAGYLHRATTIYRRLDNNGESKIDFRYEQFEEWVRTHLLPNLPKNSVVVLCSASYDKKITAPTHRALKSEREEWLRNMGIPFEPTMTKQQLCKLVNRKKDTYKNYAIDKILEDKGHSVLRIPPYHPDLNPLKLAWEIKKDLLGITPRSNNLNDIVNFILKNIISMETTDRLQDLCEKVSEIEDLYSMCDYYMDDLIVDYRTLPEESDTSNTDSEAEKDKLITNTDDDELE